MTTAPATTDRQQLTGTYTIDPSHTRLGFVARHAMVTKVRGSFNSFAGSFTIDGADPSNSSAQITIDADSVDTRDAGRDEHLRSNDFFGVEDHPQIAFVSTSIEEVATDEFRVIGDLTIRGVTKPVTIDLEFTGSAVDPFGNTRVGFEGATKVNRKDWGLTWNAALETGGILVSEQITLEFEVSAIKDA
jgi:polyisoprenoid-binding protein YceI